MTIDEGIAAARALLGKRIEIPVHYDNWMRGARCGVVTSIGYDGGYVNVKLDHPSIKRRQKVWRGDYDYVKVI